MQRRLSAEFVKIMSVHYDDNSSRYAKYNQQAENLAIRRANVEILRVAAGL
jgi:hypothetical protein